MNTPIVILVRPQMGENIGAVARAMANFGLSELRIVAPRDGWPNPHAEAMATNALPILQAAKVFDDMASAMVDVTRAYATTARPRELSKHVLTPDEAMAEITQATDKMALVFGPERTGLTNDDLGWCETIITIPTTENSSLNIAQSAVVVAYEWWKRQGIATPTIHNLEPAPMAEYDALFAQAERYLDRADFFKVPEKKPGMWLNIKTMLLRGRFTSQEIRTMHGVIRALFEAKP